VIYSVQTSMLYYDALSSNETTKYLQEHAYQNKFGLAIVFNNQYTILGERNQAMRKFCAEEFRIPMKCRHHQRGLFATMVVQLLT